jgi:DNA-damage-inducible protein D
MENLPAFDKDPSESLFEKKARSNEFTYWLATELMELLGYDNRSAFRNAISKAQIACANLNIPVEENFIHIISEIGSDTKMTRFACYLVAMNADSRKPQVAKAQVYFATLAESFRQYYEQAENVIRVQIRGEISEREKSLAGVASQAGIEQWALFQNAGYRGLYNMHLYQLRQLKGIPGNRTPLDFMGKTELAANLFRITQTEEKIKSENIRGQTKLENTAEFVGKEIRKTMIKLSGQTPESIPPVDDIKIVKKEIKQTHKKLRKLDDRSPKKKNQE